MRDASEIVLNSQPRAQAPCSGRVRRFARALCWWTPPTMFACAALLKIHAPQDAAEYAVHAFGVPVPISRTLVLALAGIELIPVALLVGLGRRRVVPVACLLLVVAAGLATLAGGQRTCGCFGGIGPLEHLATRTLILGACLALSLSLLLPRRCEGDTGESK